MQAFLGTWRLVRLALRRDRIKLPIWIAGLTITNIAMVSSLNTTYSTALERGAYAAAMGPSVLGRMFGGILDGSSLGAITMVETYVFTGIFIALMSMQIISRHTRQNEENGSAELIHSMTTGRYAPLTAAFIVMVGANLIVWLATVAGIWQQGYLPIRGAWLMFGSLALVGISYGLIASVLAQVSENTRTVNLLGTGVICLTVFTRALGDGLATVPQSGEAMHSTWLSWLSPLGLGQQIYPYTRQEYWPLAALIFLCLISLAAAYVLLSKRDIGSGLLQPKLGLAHAKRFFVTPLGLAWRLCRGPVLAWFGFLVLLGLTYGYMGNQFKDLLANNDIIKRYLTVGIDEQQLINAFYGAMVGMSMMLIVGMIVQILQRLRTEEASGYLESIAATGRSRTLWLGGFVLLAMLSLFVSLLLFAGIFSATVRFTSQADWHTVWLIIKATLVYIPALMLFVGLMICTFGFLPRATSQVGWLAAVWTFIISQFGTLFAFPQWLLNTSPFGHTPNLMIRETDWLPLSIMTAAGILLILLGMWRFGHRDISTSN